MSNSHTPRAGWTFAIVSVALFMSTLDNLVVGVALPSIRADFGSTLESLQWTVNAYTIAYAVLLLTGAALGDRFGRKRMFMLGLGVFTFASALSALAPSAAALIAARALLGVGAAMVTPLTLTLLSEAVPAERRAAAIGAWAGIGGLGVAMGPVVGGAVVNGLAWQWIFWLNVPIGLALLPLSARFLTESRGPNATLDLPGVSLASVGLTSLVFGIVRASDIGWTAAATLASLSVGAILLTGFVVWEHRSPAPMLPLRFFKNRAFTATNLTGMAMFFGVFGSIFFLSQFFQTVQGMTALQSGLRTLPWTAAPMVVAPIAGVLAGRYGARPFLVAGMLLQSVSLLWLSQVTDANVLYSELIVPFILGGIGMGLVFATSASAVLAAVSEQEAGQASGAANMLRELGGVLGVAVLATVFSTYGSYASPQAFADGMTAALPVGGAITLAGAIAASLVPSGAGSTADLEARDVAVDAALQPQGAV